MMLLIFVLLIIVGRLSGKKQAAPVKLRVDSSRVASGSIRMTCGCRISKEATSPCQAHRVISSVEGH